MIHSFRFSNFFSFAEEAEVSFVLDGRGGEHESGFASGVADRRLSKILAVVGANGAGKTNIIKALDFLCWFVAKSFFTDSEQGLMVQPHLLAQDDVSKFELEFETDGQLFRYVLHLNRERVLLESLSLKKTRVFSELLRREWNAEQGEDEVIQRGFGMPAKQAKRVKPLASLISTAEQFGVEIAQKVVHALARCQSNVDAIGRQGFRGAPDVLGAAKYYADSEEHRVRMASLLKQWDFGLDDVQLEKLRMVRDGKEEEILVPVGIHRDGQREMRIPLIAESSGTQAAFVLLSRLLPTLARGGIVLFDELESDLHPLMLEPILNLFISPRTNPHHAQLVFTCHSLEILNLLKKGQILLVEKNEHCRSDAWRLSDMDVRSDDNFYAKYMAGAYGAVPQL